MGIKSTHPALVGDQEFVQCPVLKTAIWQVSADDEGNLSGPVNNPKNNYFLAYNFTSMQITFGVLQAVFRHLAQESL